MKFFSIVLLLALPLSAFSADLVLQRSWARSTLLTPYYGFRGFSPGAPVLTPHIVLQVNPIDGVKAFERKSGNELWSFQVKNGAEGAAATDEAVFFGAGDGKFYCLDLLTGKVLWTKELGSESLTRPVILNNVVYHVSANNSVFAMDQKTGESIWVKSNTVKSSMTVRGQSSPLINSGLLYTGLSDGRAIALNIANGREIWSRRIGDDKKFNDVDSRPVLAKNCLLISSFANALYCLDKSSGQINWRHDQGGQRSALYRDGKIFYPTLAGPIHVLDADSGKLLKEIKDIKGMASELQAMGSFLVYGESGGSLVLRDFSSLEKRHFFQSGSGIVASPEVDVEKSQIYFTSRDGVLYRFNLVKESFNPFAYKVQ